MTYSEPVRNQKPNRLGTGNRTEPNRFLNYIPRNRTEPNREPEIHQFLETETEPNRTDPTLLKRRVLVLVFAAEFASEGLDLKSNPGKTWFGVTLEHVDAILVCSLGFWQVSHFKTPSEKRWQVPSFVGSSTNHGNQPALGLWLMLKLSLTNHKSHH